MKRLCSFLLGIFFLASCQSSSTQDKGKPLVVTSIPPYVSLVKAIVGDSMTVTSATGGNFEPHTSEVTPRHMKAMQNADLFIGIGEPYEKKLLNAINQGSHHVHSLELAQKVPLLSFSEDSHVVNACHGSSESHQGGEDRHIWLGPDSLILQVNHLIEAVSLLNPEMAYEYDRNGKALIAKIRKLIENLQEELRPFQKRAIIISHPALGYFCHEFHLLQIAVECEGKEPLPRDAANILRFAKNADAICVFTAPQFNNKGAEMIAQQLNLRVENFDPLNEDPLATIQHVANAITQ